MRARDQSDNDQRHKRNEDNILKHLEMLQDHATHFESLGTVTTMLVEGVNMQLEAELADLLDRSMTALYGVTQTSNKEEIKA
jgi:wyosine [tRNA(Phe)-imidazoG37] synthetase (radical SAM superfamily)